jgi:hypothetical protein
MHIENTEHTYHHSVYHTKHTHIHTHTHTYTQHATRNTIPHVCSCQAVLRSKFIQSQNISSTDFGDLVSAPGGSTVLCGLVLVACRFLVLLDCKSLSVLSFGSCSLSGTLLCFGLCKLLSLRSTCGLGLCAANVRRC